MSVKEFADDVAREAHVAALRVELEGYVRYGRDDRADGVRAELARLGDKTARGRRRGRETAVDTTPTETPEAPADVLGLDQEPRRINLEPEAE